jgi:succinate dehydrogenase hydrophobic anchor subunit
MPKRPRRILRRRWATAEGWRGTRAGMWAWLVQRAAAVVLVHGLLGVRAILLDFGLPVRWHRLLLVGAAALAAVIFGAVWGWRWS